MDVVEYIVDHPVRMRFEDRRRQLSSQGSPAEELFVFHGTYAEAPLESILYTGFEVGGTNGVPVRNGRAYGVGVYAATGNKTKTFSLICARLIWSTCGQGPVPL